MGGGGRFGRGVAAGVVLLAMACRSEEAPRDAELTVAIRADVTGFFPNPPLVNESFTIEINRAIFEGLVRFDHQLRLVPGLAERWENPDERTYVFDLAPGLRFSDGQPVTAADVAASLDANRRSWVTGGYLQAVESVRAVSERRVEIRTRFPYLALLTRLPWGFVLPASALERSPAPNVGTGPYRLERWSPGREFVFVRNARFRGPAPAFARARFHVVEDDRERVGLVERREADLADHVPLDDLSRLQKLSGVEVVVRPSLRVLFLALRMDRPPFSDPRVREAVDLALDREELSRRVLFGLAAPATQMVPPAVVGYNPALGPGRPDRARARQLLAQAGYPGGLSLRLDGPRNRYVRDAAIAGEVARQLHEVGIRAEVNLLDKLGFFRLIGSGASAFHLLGWACDSGDAGDVLDSLLHSPAAGQLGGFNNMGLVDAELDRLIDAANRSESDPDRARRLQAALARASELRATLPLVVQTEALALSRRIAWDPPLSLGLRVQDVRLRGTAAAPR